MKILENKTVVIGVTGSIAAYKTPVLVRMLIKKGADVHVLMTKNAANFITPITFESLTGHKCITDTFDRNFSYNVEHVALAKAADVVMIAPASADVIGKIASGIADDMLTTTVMACTCKKIIAPAMNHNMYHNPIVEDNLRKLAEFGYEMIAPETGMLANGDAGDGRMPEPDVLEKYILREIAYKKDLAGKKVLVTAGATEEAIDPVRYITNHSSGKMGYALAENAMLRGAEVTLVAGKTSLSDIAFVKMIKITTAAEMASEVKKAAAGADIIVMAAAVADYRPIDPAAEKIKKADSGAMLELERTEDILAYIGAQKKNSCFVCGFSMETENLAENSRRKLTVKNADMIVANDLKTEGAGFGVDTNVVTLITKNGTKTLAKMPKTEVAEKIFDNIRDMIYNK